MCIPPRASSGLNRSSRATHQRQLTCWGPPRTPWTAEPERHVQDGHVIYKCLDDLKDGHLHDLFFCAVLHRLDQENLTQRNRDALCGDAHAQRYAQKKRHNSNEFLWNLQIPCSNQFGIRIELAVLKKLANAVLVRGRKSLQSHVLVFGLGLDKRSGF